MDRETRGLDHGQPVNRKGTNTWRLSSQVEISYRTAFRGRSALLELQLDELRFSSPQFTNALPRAFGILY